MDGSKSVMEDDFESTTLHSAPSFAIYNNPDGDDGITQDEILKKTVLLGDNLEVTGSGEFSFENKKMDLIEEGENENDWSNGIQNLSIEEEDVEPASPPMYLASGLGVDADAGFDKLMDGDIFNPNLQESEDLEGYYKRMIDEYPCHPLLLKKYAQLLQSNGDLQEAEEYFLRATMADPNDSETLTQYAKLTWENHRDKDTALVYFERAVQAAPQDSHVLAAYASFLWKVEDFEDEDGKHEIQSEMKNQETELLKPSKETSDPISQLSVLSSRQEIDAAQITAANSGDESNFEDYLKKMIAENPNNPLFLKKYAQFLLQSKRDHQEAEDYYSRAIVADPSDGEIISEYAKLVWELHHDEEKASFLFEQAVQATPGDSNVLAAYTSFLWETDDGES
ncbi:uncharacterized protein LOC114190722 [Vigna unguiculata]|uniref:uncharacterized protein LOC114190722 n=1 Tax=Vigna unguiculata TaxID=3917 RepID=UPI0010163EB8|nr:uncharacterized protein LOC114190722 [Vigna unguiculata]